MENDLKEWQRSMKIEAAAGLLMSTILFMENQTKDTIKLVKEFNKELKKLNEINLN
mgnify:CR=1 FL=1